MRIQLILIRLLLLALFLGAWEVLPRTGVINPVLLPPFGDVIATLVQILGRSQVHEAILVPESITNDELLLLDVDVLAVQEFVQDPGGRSALLRRYRLASRAVFPC